MPRLVAVVIDGLLTQDDDFRTFLFNDGLQDFGNCQRFGTLLGFNQYAPVRTHGERCSDGFLTLGDADRYGDDLFGGPGFFKAERRFNADFIEWIHGHFDVCGLNTGAVALNAYFHVVIDNPFYGDENFHCEFPWRSTKNFDFSFMPETLRSQDDAVFRP